MVEISSNKINSQQLFFFFFAAEFVIYLADENDTFEKYKKALEERDAQFSVSQFV